LLEFVFHSCAPRSSALRPSQPTVTKKKKIE